MPSLQNLSSFWYAFYQSVMSKASLLVCKQKNLKVILDTSAFITSPPMIKSPHKFQLYLQPTFIYFHYHHITLSLVISLPWTTIIKSSLFNFTYSWPSLTHLNLYFAWSFFSQGIWLSLTLETILTSITKQKGRQDKFQKFC